MALCEVMCSEWFSLSVGCSGVGRGSPRAAELRERDPAYAPNESRAARIALAAAAGEAGPARRAHAARPRRRALESARPDGRRRRAARPRSARGRRHQPAGPFAASRPRAGRRDRWHRRPRRSLTQEARIRTRARRSRFHIHLVSAQIRTASVRVHTLDPATATATAAPSAIAEPDAAVGRVAQIRSRGTPRNPGDRDRATVFRIAARPPHSLLTQRTLRTEPGGPAKPVPHRDSAARSRKPLGALGSLVGSNPTASALQLGFGFLESNPTLRLVDRDPHGTDPGNVEGTKSVLRVSAPLSSAGNRHGISRGRRTASSSTSARSGCATCRRRPSRSAGPGRP
jgi:hypothetical protein